MAHPTSDSTGLIVLEWYQDARKILINFVLMAIFFSLNHGTVVALIALASADLGENLGSYVNGTLYCCYTLVALTVAAGIVQHTGAKWGLTISLFLYCSYVASFLVAHTVPSVKWPVCLVGSAVGGIAAGWLWVAQGAYFSRTCSLYARAKNISITEATGYLAGIFATFYVGGELLLRGLSSLLFDFKLGNVFVFTVFTIIAVSSAILFGVFVRTLPPKEDGEKAIAQGVFHKATLAVRLLIKNPKVILLAPLQITFGFSAAYMNLYVNNKVGKPAVGGESNLGYLGVFIAATATLASIPYSFVGKKVGKLPMMCFGAANFVAIAAVVGLVPVDKLVDLGWGIAFVYVLQGSGRAVFEGTNKAVFAQFFPHDQEAAFANVIIQSGGASTFAYFVFPHISDNAKALCTVVSGVLAIICLKIAFTIHASGKDAEEERLLARA